MDDLSYKGTDSPLLSISPFPCKEWQFAAEDFIHTAHKYLFTSGGKEYRDYLLARGITQETMIAKKIGRVPLKDGKWIESSFARWGLNQDNLTPDQYAKRCVRIPDGLLFPHYGEDGKPWKLSMYRPLAELLPGFKRGRIAGSKECLLNEQLMSDRSKPIIMTESFLDAISIEQEAGDLVIATSTDGSPCSRDLRCQAKLQYAPFVLQAFDNDNDGRDGAEWWGSTIKNCVRWAPSASYKDPNEMLVGGAHIRRWVEVGLSIATTQQTIARASIPLPEPIEEEEPIDVCFLCKGELHSYTSQGTPCCEIHYQGRETVEQAMQAFTVQTVERVETDPLTQFAQTVDTIAGIFAPCEIHRDPPGYTLSDHVAFLNDKKRREEIAREVAMRRLQADRRYQHLHGDESAS